MSNPAMPDFMLMYRQYQDLKPGPKAELKRAALLSGLTEIPAFYKLLQGFRGDERMQRLVFCLPLISHRESGMSLGRALAEADVNEKRLFMVIRSEAPNDLIQLRRLLRMVEPEVNWQPTAKSLYYWNDIAKRTLLEDFFYYQNSNSTA